MAINDMVSVELERWGVRGHPRLFAPLSFPGMRTRRGIIEIKSLFDLEGKVAVVTGASGALGRAVSLGLAAYGVDIVACSLEKEALEELAEEIGDTTGRKALSIFCDVTNEESVDRMVNRSMGRAAEPEDFIGATVFLASDASEMVTAHILSVDGGTAGG